MSRRIELENIIIGTLLDDVGDEHYVNDCRSFITKEMFEDETNRALYGYIMELSAKGMDYSPLGIYSHYGQSVTDLVPAMVEKVTDYSFVHKKSLYNERQWLGSQVFGVKPIYTDIRFSDYVMAFIKMAVISIAV